MPLILAEVEKEYEIVRLSGTAQVRQHLADLGFHAGGRVKAVSRSGNGMIVNIKGARVALGRELANRIYV